MKGRLLGAFVGVLIAPGVTAQPGFPAWVGLYEPTKLGWLENENRIAELCGASADLSTCYSRMLAPAVDVYDLRSEPDELSTRIGGLVVVAVPGRGLSAYFQPPGSTETTSFVPDLFLQDWGYGPFMHQTFAQRQGDWFQLPRAPWDTPVWVHRPTEQQRSSIIHIQAGDIIELRGSGMYVVEAEPDTLSLRSEQPADVWCGEGDPPPLVAEEPIRLARAELLDQDGHLIFRLKYLKGC